MCRLVAGIRTSVTECPKELCCVRSSSAMLMARAPCVVTWTFSLGALVALGHSHHPPKRFSVSKPEANPVAAAEADLGRPLSPNERFNVEAGLPVDYAPPQQSE